MASNAYIKLKFSKRQKELITGLFLPVLFVAGFGASEGGLRLLQFVKFGIGDSVERSTKFFVDDQTELRLPVPDSRLMAMRVADELLAAPVVRDYLRERLPHCLN